MSKLLTYRFYPLSTSGERVTGYGGCVRAHSVQKGKFVANDQPANLAGSPGSAIGTKLTLCERGRASAEGKKQPSFFGKR